MTIKLEVVTAEKVIFSGEVDILTAPGAVGQMGVLPHHAPLMTVLDPGELRYRKGSEETVLAVSGGFLEVRPDRIIVLADAAERADEIDLARAEAAKKRAEERLANATPEIDTTRAEAALRRALARIRVAEKRQRRLRQGPRT